MEEQGFSFANVNVNVMVHSTTNIPNDTYHTLKFSVMCISLQIHEMGVLSV